MTGHNGSPEVTRARRAGRRPDRAGDRGRGARGRHRRLVRLLRAPPRHALQHLRPRRPRRADRAAAKGARVAGRVLPLPPGVRLAGVRPRLLHGRHRDLPRQRLLRELAHPRAEGRRGRAAAACEPDARGAPTARTPSTGGSARPRPTSCGGRRRRCSADRPAPPRLHDVLARDNGVFAVFSDQVGFDGHSTHVGGAYVLAPDGAMIARTEPGVESALDRRRPRPGPARARAGESRRSRSESAVPRPTRS